MDEIHSENVSNSGDSHVNEFNFSEVFFDLCRTEDGKISVKLFLEELEKFGILSDDPRLENMMNLLEKLKPPSAFDVGVLKLDPQIFKTMLSENILLVYKALQHSFIIPDFEQFTEEITKIFEKCQYESSGKVADYIPQLAAYDLNHWGISLTTSDGQRFGLGHSKTPFTLQGVSQVLTYAICLNELGKDRVHRFQGREPSGRSFNDIALDYHGKPHNPLLNSGGLLSIALIMKEVKCEFGQDIAAKYDFIFTFIKKMAGNGYLHFNNSAFLSEINCSDRNKALAHFLIENKCIPEGVDVQNILRLYCQICSLEMTCESLSVLASTLANGGICPLTNERCLDPEAVSNVTSLMYSCGMYNYSGQFAFDVGIPAKSGISGVTLLAIPRLMGFALWSPGLDNFKNSVRATKFCQELVAKYSFHRFDNIGQSTKTDPSYNKGQTAGATVVQVLLAASNNDKLSLQRFWLREIDLNIGDYDDRTPLHLAASEGHYETVKFLLETCKVTPNPIDRWQQTPLSEATRFRHYRVANLIKNHLMEISSEDAEISQFLSVATHSRMNSMSSDRVPSPKPLGGDNLDRLCGFLAPISKTKTPISSPPVGRRGSYVFNVECASD